MQKGFTPILIVILLAALVAVGGMVLLTQNNYLRLTFGVPIVNLPSVSSLPTKIPEVIDTTNWKTYTDPQKIYTFQYPSDWEVVTRRDAVYIESPRFGDGPEPLYYYIYLSRGKNDQNLSPEDLVAGKMDKVSKSKLTVKQEIINNLTGYRGYPIPGMFSCESVFFIRSDKEYTGLTFCPFDKQQPLSDQSKYYKIYNQILSTFKFTDLIQDGSTCLPKFPIEQADGMTGGISASQEYTSRCTEQKTKAECEKVDIYRASTKNFGNPDGTPDCSWATK